MGDVLQFVAMGLAITGVEMNNRRLRWCFVVWLISNSISFYYHVGYGLGWLAVRDAVFCLLAVRGWVLWSKGGGGAMGPS